MEVTSWPVIHLLCDGVIWESDWFSRFVFGSNSTSEYPKLNILKKKHNFCLFLMADLYDFRKIEIILRHFHAPAALMVRVVRWFTMNLKVQRKMLKKLLFFTVETDFKVWRIPPSPHTIVYRVIKEE